MANKVYRWVQHIVMANDTDVETIGTYVLGSPSDAADSLDDAMDDADMLKLAGWGKHSGRKLWQAPVSVQNQVADFLEKQAERPPTYHPSIEDQRLNPYVTEELER